MGWYAGVGHAVADEHGFGEFGVAFDPVEVVEGDGLAGADDAVACGVVEEFSADGVDCAGEVVVVGLVFEDVWPADDG